MKHTRTTCLDASVLATTAEGAGPGVNIRRYTPDMENLPEQVANRIQTILETEHPPYLYANPIVTITSAEPTPQFFAVIRMHQAEWCKKSQGNPFPRHLTRHVKDWFTFGEKSKYRRFLVRGLCFTGLLYVQGRVVPNHEWPRHGEHQ